MDTSNTRSSVGTLHALTIKRKEGDDRKSQDKGLSSNFSLSLTISNTAVCHRYFPSEICENVVLTRSEPAVFKVPIKLVTRFH